MRWQKHTEDTGGPGNRHNRRHISTWLCFLTMSDEWIMWLIGQSADLLPECRGRYRYLNMWLLDGPPIEQSPPFISCVAFALWCISTAIQSSLPTNTDNHEAHKEYHIYYNIRHLIQSTLRQHYSIDVSGVKQAPVPQPLTLCIQPRKTTNVPAAKAAARSNTCSLYTSHACQPSVIRLTFFFFCGCFSASRLLLDLSHGFLWKARRFFGHPLCSVPPEQAGWLSHIHTAYNLCVILRPPFMVLFSLVSCYMVSTMSKMHLQGTVELKIHVPNHIV